MLQHACASAFDHTVTVSTGEARAIDLKVLHLVNGEHFAGAERVPSHLGRCLPRHGISADFAFVKRGRFARLLSEQSGQWGEGYDATNRNPLDMRVAFRVRDLVRDHGYELLHAHTPRTAMIASLASTMTGIPWVYHVYRPAGRDCEKLLSSWLSRWIEKQSLRGCEHMIAVSESLRLDCIAKGADEENVTVVHNGVPAIRPERDSIPQPGGRWTLGIVALMRPCKGLEILLEAVQQLNREGHDVALRCIGPFESANYEQGIERQIDQLGIRDRVQRVGFTEDVPGALAQLDAMVLPSLFGEGLPMIVLEAMAAALPVIATRVEGTPEAITNGVEGLLAEPRDSASLADAIRSLVTGQTDWSLMAEAACQRHGRCFSDLAMASATADVYRNLV